MDLWDPALCPCPSPASDPSRAGLWVGAGQALDTQQRQEVSAQPGAGDVLRPLCAFKFKQHREEGLLWAAGAWGTLRVITAPAPHVS